MVSVRSFLFLRRLSREMKPKLTGITLACLNVYGFLKRERGQRFWCLIITPWNSDACMLSNRDFFVRVTTWKSYRGEVMVMGGVKSPYVSFTNDVIESKV